MVSFGPLQQALERLKARRSPLPMMDYSHTVPTTPSSLGADGDIYKPAIHVG
ncbi:hypothetical protein HMPREF3223_00853 [Cutibacterium avidum]|nr:hypothetical protein HMPREF3223_00853 [Cutibacterium avidum]